MKKFVFREARLLALRKQEVTLAEVRVAQASERVRGARAAVEADVAALDELAHVTTGASRSGVTALGQLALGMRARLEVSRARLTEREAERAVALDGLRKAKVAMESLATLKTARHAAYRKTMQKEWQQNLDDVGTRMWLTEERHG